MLKSVLGVSLIALVSLLPVSALASIGVGVGTGRIVVDEPIYPGKIYTLPPITVFNTGTETATYTVAVTLNQAQPENKPDPKWISFSPATFTLSPKKSQIVVPTLHPPLRAEAGKYFAYLEAHPAATVKQGSTAVGVAAATKLSFTMESANFFVALWYRLLALLQHHAPWSYGLIGAVIVAAAYWKLRKHFNFSFKITKV